MKTFFIFGCVMLLFSRSVIKLFKMVTKLQQGDREAT